MASKAISPCRFSEITARFFGTLCAFDSLPINVPEKHLQTFELMANLIAFELEAEEQRARTRGSLKISRTNQ